MDSTPHIAVVDDHRDIRDLVGKYLTKHGYRVSIAENAAALRTAAPSISSSSTS